MHISLAHTIGCMHTKYKHTQREKDKWSVLITCVIYDYWLHTTPIHGIQSLYKKFADFLFQESSIHLLKHLWLSFDLWARLRAKKNHTKFVEQHAFSEWTALKFFYQVLSRQFKCASNWIVSIMNNYTKFIEILEQK